MSGTYISPIGISAYRSPRIISGDNLIQLKDLARIFGQRIVKTDDEVKLHDAISAKDALNGARIEFWIDSATAYTILRNPQQHYIGWVGNRFGGVFDDASRETLTFRVDVINDTQFKLYSEKYSTTMFCHIEDNESLKVIPNVKVTNGTDIFTFCSSSYGNDSINLANMKLSQFLQTVWTLRMPTVNRPACVWDNWRSWNTPCAGTNTAQRVNIVWLTASPFMDKLASYMKDENFKVRCCTGDISGDEKVFCNLLALANANDQCDTQMDVFCTNPDHAGDPYCGCYDVALDKEITTMPAYMQQYGTDLKKQPKCWSKGCKVGYERKNTRGAKCDYGLCNNSNGENTYCRNDVPLQEPEPLVTKQPIITE